MASYQVMFWKHIPSQVKAWEGDAHVKCMMPSRFQVAIDAFAMRDGSTDMDSYLEGWRWGPTEERAGSPDEVLAAVVTELDRAHPRARLMNPEASQ